MIAKRRGSILIVVLFVSVALGLLAVSLTYRSALILRASRHRAIMVKLQAQADSAATIAMKRLADNTNDFDHPAEPWHTHAPLATEGWLDDWTEADGVKNAMFVADYRVTDEDGKLHVLMASSESLRKLGMSDEQTACLFDYMDADDFSQPGGAEDSYYRSLSVPRRCKNAPLEMLDELLAIKGFGPRDYWGPRRNEDIRADGMAQMQGWAELLTCCGSGKVNINTASRGVLQTLGISEAAIDQIDAFRTFDAFSSGILEDHVFKNPDDVNQLQGLQDVDRQMLLSRITFRSHYFRILVTVRHVQTGLRYALDVLVRANEDRIDVLQWRQAA